MSVAELHPSEDLGPRPHPAERHRGRAVRPRRHAAEQGRDRRRRRGAARGRLLPPGPRRSSTRRSSTSTAGASRPTPSPSRPSSPAPASCGRVGGAPYLHTLVSMVPTAANAGYYGRIVREQAILRRLVEAGTRIVSDGLHRHGRRRPDGRPGPGRGLRRHRPAHQRGLRPAQRHHGRRLNEIEAISNRGGEMVGVPTGFTELDKLTNGLHPGQMIIVAARPAIGKVDPRAWTSPGRRPSSTASPASSSPWR